MLERPLLKGDLEAITVVSAFLVWAEGDNPGMMYGSHNIGEAIEAMAHIVGCKPDKLRAIRR